MPTIMDKYAVITKAGKTAALNAGTLGPKIEITGIKIGSLSVADGALALPTDTDVDGLVYQAGISSIYYGVISEEACVFRIELDESVGDFQIGQIGLMMAGGVLFAKVVLPKQSAKWRSNPPGRIGNVKTYDLILQLSDIEACIDLTILKSLYASLPEVATEHALPAPLTAPFPVYGVRNHTELGIPCLAYRFNNYWQFSTSRKTASQGEGVAVVTPDKFADDVKINMPVYLNTKTGKYEIAFTDTEKTGICGVRTSDYEVTFIGRIKRHVADDVWPENIDPLTWLYVQDSGSLGYPSPKMTFQPYGIALDNDTVYVNLNFAANAYFAWDPNDPDAPSPEGDTPMDMSHRHPNVTWEADGFMSKDDKIKLDLPETFVIGQGAIRTFSIDGGKVGIDIDHDTFIEELTPEIQEIINAYLRADRGNYIYLKPGLQNDPNPENRPKLVISSDIDRGIRPVMTFDGE